MTSSDLMGAVEAAGILGVSERTAKRMARNGELPFETKMKGEKGAYVFHRDAVELVRARLDDRRRQRIAELEEKLDRAKAKAEVGS